MNEELLAAIFQAAQEVWPNTVRVEVDGIPWGFMIIDGHLQGAPLVGTAKERKAGRRTWPDLTVDPVQCAKSNERKRRAAFDAGRMDAEAGRPYRNPHTYQPLDAPASAWAAYLNGYTITIQEAPETIGA